VPLLEGRDGGRLKREKMSSRLSLTLIPISSVTVSLQAYVHGSYVCFSGLEQAHGMKIRAEIVPVFARARRHSARVGLRLKRN
jgi:hypothetical protein